MKCPRCSGPLNPSSLRELSINYNAHRCTNCQGMWIGPRQLAEIESTVDQRFVEVRRIPNDEEQKKVLHCPACEGSPAMNKATNRRDSNVVIDVCPKCHHVWLDKGEREAIEQQSLIQLMQDFFGSK